MRGSHLIRAFVCAAGIVMVSGAADSPTRQVTWTGWFSDSQCASARAAAGIIGPTNPDCAKTCIRKGAAPAFISEQAKAVFQVRDYAAVIHDLGYHLEISATLNERTKTLSVLHVNRLSYEGASCGRPRRTGSPR